jgi:hypothetical protein
MRREQHVLEDAQKRIFNRKFGKLYALPIMIKEETPNDNYRKHTYKIKCVCECGNVIYVEKRLLLTKNFTKSCGCTSTNNLIEYNHTRNKFNGDNHKDSPYYHLYNSWVSMKNRCLNPTSKSYINYGAKGISICDEWLDYTNFKQWALNNNWDESLTIDRIDNNKNYEPSNCKWSTYLEQENHRCDNINITYKGKTQTLSMWCRELDMNINTIKYRLNNPKFTSIEDVFERPLQRYNKTHKQNSKDKLV